MLVHLPTIPAPVAAVGNTGGIVLAATVGDIVLAAQAVVTIVGFALIVACLLNEEAAGLVVAGDFCLLGMGVGKKQMLFGSSQ